jgi:beta-glucosidase
MGWAIHPQGFRRMIDLAAGYGLPLYITENGIADREDRMREKFLNAHLEVIEQSRHSGVDIRGYYYWSLLDNFEWIKGFAPRFGLYRVDYDTLERSLNPSAKALVDWIKTPRPD